MGHQYRLDLLRFGSALLVLIGHFAYFGLSVPEQFAPDSDRAFAELAPVGWFGWIGVQIFFVISGYVIAASATGTQWQTFLTKRFIRIFPTLWACSFIALSIRVAWGEPLALVGPDFIRSIMLSPKGPYIDGVVWTLVVEAVFYGLVAITISVSANRNVQIELLEKLALWLGSISAIFLLIAVIAETLDLTLSGQPLSNLLNRFPFKVLLLWHGVFFALGILIWSIHRTGLTTKKLAWATVFIVLGVVEISLKAELGNPLVPITIWFIGISVIALVKIDTYWRPAPGMASFTQRLGLMSYPLYLGHFTLGMYLIPMLSPMIDNRALLLGVVVVIIFSLAWLIVIGPERLIQNWARRSLLVRVKID